MVVAIIELLGLVSRAPHIVEGAPPNNPWITHMMFASINLQILVSQDPPRLEYVVATDLYWLGRSHDAEMDSFSKNILST